MAKRYFSNVAECMKLMLKPGTTTKNFANRAKDKTALFASLVMSNEQTLDYINNNKIKSEKQQRILMYLIKNGQTLQSELIEKTEASRAIVKTLEKNGFLKLQEQKVVRNPLLNKNITRILQKYNIFVKNIKLQLKLLNYSFHYSNIEL